MGSNKHRHLGRRKGQAVPYLGILILVMTVIALAGLIYLAQVLARLFYSIESKEVSVPNIYGLKIEEASAILTGMNLGFRVKDSAYSEEVGAGRVIWQMPPADSKVKEGRIVQVVKSLGKPSLIVPKVVGLNLEKAQEEIFKARLSVGEVRKVYVKDKRRGEVVSQTPEALRTFPSPVRVDLVVAETEVSEASTMPKVVGLPLSQAEKELFRTNLLLSKVKYVPSFSDEPGTVISQVPSAGESVEVGAKVTLEVGIGQEAGQTLGRTFLVDFRLPPTLPAGKLTIEVVDAHGRSQIFNEEVTPGERIEQTITTAGTTKVRILLDGRLIREDEA